MKESITVIAAMGLALSISFSAQAAQGAGASWATQAGPLVTCTQSDGTSDYVPSMLCKQSGGTYDRD